jgi:hypothetical protein
MPWLKLPDPMPSNHWVLIMFMRLWHLFSPVCFLSLQRTISVHLPDDLLKSDPCISAQLFVGLGSIH